MPETNFFKYLEQIKAGNQLFPVTLLFGFNEFLGEKIIQLFAKKFLEEKSEFNYRRYYFDSEYSETSWEQIINEANTSSFFVQSRKIIVLTIRDEKKISLKKSDVEILKKYLKKPNLNAILIIYISLDAIKDDFQQIKKQKINKLIKTLNSPHFITVDLDKISEIEVRRYIQEYLKKSGLSITASALDKIMEIKDDEFISILSQLPILEIAAVSGKSIDSEDIDKLITGVEAHSIWDLTDAIESENAGKYLKILKYLFMNGIKATLIIGTLVTHYNKIYIAKFLLKQQFPIQEIGQLLGQHPYFLQKFIQSTRRFSEKRLKYILKLIYALDYESKTSGEESARLSLQNFTFQIKSLKSSR